MNSSTKTLSNHYETLQVSPGANNNEIIEAFAAQMRTARLHPEISIARIAQLSVAYETLRDPVKRRAYDDLLGLTTKPAACIAQTPTFFLKANPPTSVPTDRPREIQADAEPAEKDPVKSRLAAFIAESVREPVRQRAKLDPFDDLERGEPVRKSDDSPPADEAQDDSSLKTVLDSARSWRPETVPEPLVVRFEEVAANQIDLPQITSRRATILAGVVGAGILVFAISLPQKQPDRLVGLHSQAQQAVTLPLPPAAAAEQSLASPQAAPVDHGNALQQRKPTTRRAVIASKSQSPSLAPVAELPASTSSEDATKDAGSSEAKSVDVAAAEPVAQTSAAADSATKPPETSQAKLPLANATIARTIERIGYPCGSVVSTSSVDGAPGVYNVICSSGETYRATPVQGRYHFRRMAR